MVVITTQCFWPVSDFLFASLDIEDLPKWDLLLKERISSVASLFLEWTLIEKGGKNANSRVAYPESVLICLM